MPSGSKRNGNPFTPLAVNFVIFRVAVTIGILIVWKSGTISGLRDLGRQVGEAKTRAQIHNLIAIVGASLCDHGGAVGQVAVRDIKYARIDMLWS